MATITRRPITLTVDETETLLGILRDTSRAQFAHANRTRSAAIRDACFTSGSKANELEAAIVRRMYSTEVFGA